MKKLLSASVILPFCISFMTGMTEAFADCVPLKPGFGESEIGDRCFFASPTAEIFWYITPIIIYFLINGIILFLAAWKIWIDPKQDLDFGLESTTELRDENMQK